MFSSSSISSKHRRPRGGVMGHLAPPNDFGGAVGTPKIFFILPPPFKIYPYPGGAVGTPNHLGGGIYPPKQFWGGKYPPKIKNL